MTKAVNSIPRGDKRGENQVSGSVSLCVGSGGVTAISPTSSSRLPPPRLVQPLPAPSPGLVLGRLAGAGERARREGAQTPEEGGGPALIWIRPVCLAPSPIPSYLPFLSSSRFPSPPLFPRDPSQPPPKEVDRALAVIAVRAPSRGVETGGTSLSRDLGWGSGGA